MQLRAGRLAAASRDGVGCPVELAGDDAPLHGPPVCDELRQEVLEEPLGRRVTEARYPGGRAQDAVAVTDHEEASAGQGIVDELAKAEGESSGLRTLGRGVAAQAARGLPTNCAEAARWSRSRAPAPPQPLEPWVGPHPSV